MQRLACQFIFLLLLIALVSCTSSIKKDPDFYVIKHPSTANPDTAKDSMPPPPDLPWLFYGHHNFILLDSSRVFYHTKHIFYKCGTGLDLSKPPRVDLLPTDLAEIKIKDLAVFLKDHVRDSLIEDEYGLRGKYTAASISSPADTIRNTAFFIIRDHFNQKKIKMYVIRNLTEEETYASAAKITGKAYDPRKMSWKIGFDHIDTFIVTGTPK